MRLRSLRPMGVTFAAVAALASTGCASIVGGTSQVVSVETNAAGRSAPGARCALSNPKGEYFVTTPGTVTINRAYDDLIVRCTLAGHDPGSTSVKSTTKAMAFGNLIFGGVVGGAVDIASGAAYEYPVMITVEMQAVAAAPGASASGTAAAAAPAPAPAPAPAIVPVGQPAQSPVPAVAPVAQPVPSPAPAAVPMALPTPVQTIAPAALDASAAPMPQGVSR